MVCGPDPEPVVKLVADTVAVQFAPKPRLSVTLTVPSLARRLLPGAPLPSEAAPGTVIDSDPATAVVVAVQVGPGLAGGQVLPAAVEVAVLVSTRPPVSGLATVTV